MRGRKPKPTALKERAGNPGKRALKSGEPAFGGSKLTPPEHLNIDARREWRRLAAELTAAGLLTVVDRAALAMYCQCYARWVEAERALKKESLIDITNKGNRIQNPLIGIANRAMELMLKAAVEFGMTPSARSRLHVEPPQTPGTLAEMLFGEEVETIAR